MFYVNKKIFFVKKNFEFQRIIRCKNQLVGSNYILFFKSNNLGYMRFGLSVGKKIGNAVLRNKTKRQLRHMLRIFKNDDKSFFTLSYDVIILVRKNYFYDKFEKNKNKLVNLLELMKKGKE